MTQIDQHKLTVAQTSGTVTLVTVDGAKPPVSYDRIVQIFKSAQAWGSSAPQLMGKLDYPAVQSVNPMEMQLTARAGRHYVVITNAADLLQALTANSGIGASGHGGTSYQSGYSITFLNADVPDDYAAKMTGVEMCQASVKATPSEATIDRAVANARQTGGQFTRQQMAERTAILAQEEVCNSFGLAAAEASRGTSYQDYSKMAAVSSVNMPGQPHILVLSEEAYASLKA